MTKKEQRERRRVEILEAALDSFIRKGYAGTKTGVLSKDLGMSEGLLFHYFPSKEALCRELAAIGLKSMEGPFAAAGDADRQIYEFVDGFFQRVRKSRNVAKMFIFMELAQNPDAVPASVYEQARSISVERDAVQTIIRGQRSGVFRQGDPQTLSYTFWNAIQGIMQGLAAYPDMSVPDTEWVMAILLNPLNSNSKVGNEEER